MQNLRAPSHKKPFTYIDGFMSLEVGTNQFRLSAYPQIWLEPAKNIWHAFDAWPLVLQLVPADGDACHAWKQSRQPTRA